MCLSKFAYPDTANKPEVYLVEQKLQLGHSYTTLRSLVPTLLSTVHLLMDLVIVSYLKFVKKLVWK